jgi:hypothetical protein
MDEIKSVLKDVLGDLMKRHTQGDFQKAQTVWEKIVGQTAAGHTKIVYLTKEKIRVNVDNSTRLYDLTRKKEKIQQELKKCLGVEDLRFRLGPIK